MALTPPDRVPNSGNPLTFNSDADYIFGWLASFVAELNAAGYPDLPQRFRVNGTVTAPAQAWEADPNTGMYRPAEDQIAWATGGVKRWHIANTFAELNVPMTGSAVQSDALDETASRLMKSGAFGLGAPTPPLIDDINSFGIAPGFYRSSTGTIGIKPPGSTGADAVLILRAGNQTTQIFSVANGGATFIRKSVNNATWTAWARLEPEKISNANGIVTRFSDGLQICTHVLSGVADPATAWGSLFISSEVVWNFPAEFIAAPMVEASVRFGGGLMGKGRPNSNSSGSVSLVSGQSLSATRVVDVMAIGRWF